MFRHKPIRLFGAGFLATFLMTMMMHPIFSTKLPNIEFATMIGTLLAGSAVPPYSLWWWVGVGEHFFNGSILFPIAYSSLFSRVLPTNSIIGGTVWGILLWLFSQTIIMPLFGYGFFASRVVDPFFIGSITLLVHALYGVIFGAMLGPVSGIAKDASVYRRHEESVRKSA
jgi:hypothetical protein